MRTRYRILVGICIVELLLYIALMIWRMNVVDSSESSEDEDRFE